MHATGRENALDEIVNDNNELERAWIKTALFFSGCPQICIEGETLLFRPRLRKLSYTTVFPTLSGVDYMLKFAAILFLIALFPFTGPAQTTSKISPRLQRILGEQPTDILAWVFFQNKGSYESLRNALPQSLVSAKSLNRRTKVRPAHELVDYSDLPVEPPYIEAVAVRVNQVRQRSKWFNGVSVLATPAQLAELEQLSFVTKIEAVARFKKDPSENEEAGMESHENVVQPPGVNSFNYGLSFNQNNQINVAAVHDLGNYGYGVVVAVFDNGFRLLTHEAFDTLETRTIATYDFVDHKVSVVPNNPAQGGHGVNTLSTIGGFKSGQLIGPAFGATYILDRTENDSSETPVEEDNWVAGIEWADSIGVDVTSTSLSYLDYDSPFPSWTWEDMDGNSTVITRAADMAVERGIVVVNSAGNSGFNASQNTLGAPADGDSVFTIGAVTSSGVRSSFSSVGPTTSLPPRIKPDVMAQGSSVRVASSSNPTGYGNSSGTSFSCPLVAGVVALMIHARPTDSPVEIMNALRSTASQASAPDNLMGWGIINAIAALSPSAVSLVSPDNSATEMPLSTQLRWTSSKWATLYHVQVATDAGFSTIVFNDSTLTDTSATTSGLVNGTTYHWRSRARNLYGWSPYSSTRTFTTIFLAPVAPILASPSDGATGQPVSLTLSWNASVGATSYRVQVSTDSLFASTVVDDSLVSGTSFLISGLAHQTTYYWHVLAKNGAGTSAYSPGRSFITVIPPPAIVDLVSPPDDSTEAPITIDFVWSAVVTTDSYRFRLSTDSTFGTVSIDDSTLTDTTRSVTTLTAGMTYFWHVQARNAGGAGPWSATRSFTTSASVSASYFVNPGWNLVALAVFTGWNLIGGLSEPVDTSSVNEIPSGTIGSVFYGYDGSYSPVSVLNPGQGYWVKATQNGSLILHVTSAPNKSRVLR